LEDICVRLKDRGSGISVRQFMIHVLNNLTTDYDLQVALLERIGDVEQPLIVIEIRAEMSLPFERINNNLNKDSGKPSMVKLDKQFRDTVLKNGEDPED
jgi:hypothetical protein